MINLKDLTYEELENFILSIGEKKFRAKQVYTWLYRGIESFDEMTDISKDLRQKLSEISYISCPKIEERYVSKLDGTKKYLLKLNDGNVIESVVMYYKHGITICISCQVGCRMGCKFCASTIGGKVRDLSAGEIIDQVLFIQKDIGERISNIVMMGIGEPFDNFENVIKFLKNVNCENGLNIGYRHISVSTCGIVPKIYEFAQYNMPVTLSISLHAPDNETRSKIMPVNNAYNVEELISACASYIDKTHRRISFEYAVINNVNDDEKSAEKLAKKLKGLLCHINLIPVNNVEENEFKKPSKEKLANFVKVIEKYNIPVTIRRELGSDISASCGQLRRNRLKNNEINNNEKRGDSFEDNSIN